MSEIAVPRVPSNLGKRAMGDALVTIAWRNLWRTRRRTWLTAGGIGFAIFIVVFARSAQVGTFELMIDNATRSFTGHIQLQHPDYQDNPRMRNTVGGVAALRRAVADHPDVVVVTPRGIGFALVSNDERSFGAQILGIDPLTEFAAFARPLPGGRRIERPGEGLVGSLLARNVGARVGGEVVVLGTGKEGGVAAMAVTIVGIFASGQAELDRSVLMIHYDEFSEAFGLGDEAHVLAVLTKDPRDAPNVEAELAADIQTDAKFVGWSELMPELQQMIDIKAWGTHMITALLLVLVTFSVVNTFIMTVFERTAELGMLKAVGMSPRAIIRMLQLEALWMSVLGVVLGVGISGVLIAVLSQSGIYLGESVGELWEQFHIPDRLYPTYDFATAAVVSLIMVVAVQFAAVLPARRVRRMNVVEALRGEE